jgi:hypothetical protein
MDVKKVKELVKALRCPMDCEKCTKTQEQCLHDLHKCVNLLFRLYLKHQKQIGIIIFGVEEEEVDGDKINSMVT